MNRFTVLRNKNQAKIMHQGHQFKIIVEFPMYIYILNYLISVSLSNNLEALQVFKFHSSSHKCTPPKIPYKIHLLPFTLNYQKIDQKERKKNEKAKKSESSRRNRPSPISFRLSESKENLSLCLDTKNLEKNR